MNVPDKYCAIENLDFLEVSDLLSLRDGSLEKQGYKIDLQNKILEKDGVLYTYTNNYTIGNTDQLIIKKDIYDKVYKKIKDSDIKNINIDEFRIVLKFGERIKIKNYYDLDSKILKVYDVYVPPNEFKINGYGKNPKQATKNCQNVLKKLLKKYNDLIPIFRIDYFIEPCVWVDKENKQIKTSYAAIALIMLVKDISLDGLDLETLLKIKKWERENNA